MTSDMKMNKYNESELLKIAKRINNNKRSYLLVNPTQAKHVPVSPTKALDMMSALGNKVKKFYPEANLVIGFAETATAIGGVVAHSLSENCNYIHTTRENVNDVNSYIFFSEEHSHATEQKLDADNLDKLFEQTSTIVLVDDEFSTGKTLVNIISQLKQHFPQIKNKKIVAASVINRLSGENMQYMSDNQVDMVWLLKVDNSKYVAAANEISPDFPGIVSKSIVSATETFQKHSFPDARIGVDVSCIYKDCIDFSKEILSKYSLENKNVLFLGTEECMLPSLLIGREIEQNAHPASVKCHSTTRSPIGVYNKTNYPIKSGFQINSFYENKRKTFIYNINKYDFVFIVTDAKNRNKQALLDLETIFTKQGCKNFVLIGG